MSAKSKEKPNFEVVLGERQSNVLTAVVREYVATAEPVGSHTIAEHYKFSVSPATIRNDMVALEEAGLLESPHTSSGRIPTEAGYRYYVKHFLERRDLPKAEEREVQTALRETKQMSDRLKDMAKIIAQHSAESVFISFGKNEIFYTGIANLFQQPEFREQLQLAHIGAMLDSLDNIIASVYDGLPDDVAVLVGSENPFGEDCSVVVGRFRMGNAAGLFGILGPTRMDYDANVARVKYINEYITDLL